jgi:hypothetical protein
MERRIKSVGITNYPYGTDNQQGNNMEFIFSWGGGAVGFKN